MQKILRGAMKAVTCRQTAQKTVASSFCTKRLLSTSSMAFKYSSTSGVKGIKGRKFDKSSLCNEDNDEADGDGKPAYDDIDFDADKYLIIYSALNHYSFIVVRFASDYNQLAHNTMHISNHLLNQHNVFIIQPYVKWGPSKSLTSPELKLEEAEALVRSIPTWTIQQSIKVPLETLNKKWIFGKGKLEEIKQILSSLRASGKMVKIR